MIEKKIEELIEILHLKKQNLITLLNFTKEQSMVIKEDDMEKLEQILDYKTSYIEKIDKLDIEFLNIFNDIKSEENIKNIDEIDVKKYPNIIDLKSSASEVYSILEEMSIIDKNNTRLMELNLEKLKVEMKDFKEVKKAYKGYHYEPNVSILLDEKK